MNNYVSPCITPVGKHVVADGVWVAFENGVVAVEGVVLQSAVAVTGIAAVAELAVVAILV